ncbi:MAG: hypothetical protein GXO61_02740 [Epsilonproteobacteria bacterium]|nr:hypothetical protein [Campylobacterota bacterium]
MRLDNLVHLLDGKLHSSPTISSLTSFTSSLSKVSRGSLFFAFEKEHIPEAIKRGAYAIVYEGDVKIVDEEIAWIEVDDLFKATTKLIRFFFIQNGVKIFEVTPATFDLAKALLSSNPNLIFLKEDITLLLDHLEKVKYLITPLNLSFLLNLEKQQIKEKEIVVVSEYLFEISFILEEAYIERLKLSPLFLKELKEVLFIAMENNLNFDLHRVYLFNHFKPFFINSQFEIVEFGKSERVLILEEECTLLPKERSFLEKKAAWAKKIYLTKSCEVEGFNKVEEISEVLYNSSFHYALLEEFEVEKLKKEELKEPTLF